MFSTTPLLPIWLSSTDFTDIECKLKRLAMHVSVYECCTLTIMFYLKGHCSFSNMNDYVKNNFSVYLKLRQRISLILFDIIAV